MAFQGPGFRVEAFQGFDQGLSKQDFKKGASGVISG